MKQTTSVFVKFTVQGRHRWEDAPSSRAYLFHNHRHLFHFKVEVEVRDLNRQIELHDLQDFSSNITWRIVGNRDEPTLRSCEQMAQYVAERLSEEWINRHISVTCSEDNECGAVVTLEPEDS